MAMFVWRGDGMSALLPRISTRQLSASSFHAHNRGHSLVGFLLNNHQRGGKCQNTCDAYAHSYSYKDLFDISNTECLRSPIRDSPVLQPVFNVPVWTSWSPDVLHGLICMSGGDSDCTPLCIVPPHLSSVYLNIIMLCWLETQPS